MNLKQAAAEKKALTPETGYNLVVLDEFGSPDEWGLYFINHYEEKEAAEAEKAAREKANPHSQYFIYGAE